MFIEFINKHFNSKDHIFILLPSHDHGCQSIEADNVYLLDTLFGPYYENLHKIFDLAQQIFLHAMFFREYMTLLEQNDSFANKTTWVIWGADLYNEPPTEQKRRIAPKLHRIATLTDQDYEVFVEKYELATPNIKVIYPVLSEISQIERYRNKTSNDGTIRVLLGHSRSYHLEHCKYLEILSAMRIENLKIICPLSYGGDIDYANKVIMTGKSLFGDKFNPITDYVSVDRYLHLLSTVHIGIFPQRRQQALGNFYYLLFLGKKIFCHTETSHYNELTKLGCHLYDLSTIGAQSAQELLHNDYAEVNARVITPVLDHSLARSYWAKAFNAKFFN